MATATEVLDFMEILANAAGEMSADEIAAKLKGEFDFLKPVQVSAKLHDCKLLLEDSEKIAAQFLAAFIYGFDCDINVKKIAKMFRIEGSRASRLIGTLRIWKTAFLDAKEKGLL